MEKEFLHKVNIEMLQRETGLTLQGIADLADVSVQTVYRWAWDKAKQGNRPSYNAFVKLLEHGASCETLFGTACRTPGITGDAEPSQDRIMEAVKKALADLGKNQ